MQQQDDYEGYVDTSMSMVPLLPTDDHSITLTCELCGQYLCCATQTICNHIFCEGCLNEYLLYINQCPQCKAKIREQVSFSNKLLDNVILEYIKACDVLELEGFSLRLDQYNAFKRRSKIERNKLIQGLEVDILDANHIWCTGKIAKILDTKDDQIKSIIVKYDKSKEKEVIEIPTTRLAVKGSYTNRKQIPHYHRKKVVIEDNGSIIEVIEWNRDDTTAVTRVTN